MDGCHADAPSRTAAMNAASFVAILDAKCSLDATRDITAHGKPGECRGDVCGCEPAG